MQQIHAMEKLQSMNPAVYRKILNYCDNAPSYRTAYATAGSYSNPVIDTLSKHTDELDDLSKVSSSLTREVVEEVTKAGSRSADNLDDIAREALDNARKRADEIIEGGTSAKGLIGHDFEDYLSKTIGGEGSFSVGGRDFDGGIGNRWWEAKSGNYWSMLEENPNKLVKFKSDMGDRLRIAIENGATYEIFSNTPIPESIKQWLTKKGITFTELLD